MSDREALQAALYDGLVSFNATAQWNVLRHAQLRQYLAEHLAEHLTATANGSTVLVIPTHATGSGDAS